MLPMTQCFVLFLPPIDGKLGSSSHDETLFFSVKESSEKERNKLLEFSFARKQ
jgi:hypothetical protein